MGSMRIESTSRQHLDEHQEAASQPAREAPIELNDDVLFVGMNTHADQWAREAAGLMAATSGRTIAIQHAELSIGADKVELGSGQVIDLSTNAGCAAFSASLGLPATQAERVASIVQSATPGSRDELAQIAQVWARGELGGSMPSRLVLSGHSVGTGIYDGDGVTGWLAFDSIKQLADALPLAAARIEDLMISACSSGYDGADAGNRAALSDWSRHFPNLKTAWGYASNDEFHSPSAAQAVGHIASWEAATRGRTTDVQGKRAVDAFFAEHHLDRPQLDGNVSTWSVARGYVEGKG